MILMTLNAEAGVVDRFNFEYEHRNGELIS
jgi:hypothetical protein